jgi:PhnB protein
MNLPASPLQLIPLLVVRDADRAIDFYVQTLGAAEVVRYVHPRGGAVSHADLVLRDARFSVTEEARAWNSDAPPSLGGSPVLLQLQVDEHVRGDELALAARQGRWAAQEGLDELVEGLRRLRPELEVSADPRTVR